MDTFFEQGPWRDELEVLRALLKRSGLQETCKWGSPCYTFEGRNVAILGRFKDYCALSFFKGALLKDDDAILVQPGKNTRSARLVRLDDPQRLEELTPVLHRYILEAIEVERSGQRVARDDAPPALPEELEVKLRASEELRAAFEGLTPGRQRAYCLYFSAAKRSATRTARVERYTKRILDGKGLRDCICGRSKKMPTCDGSHKNR